MLGEISRSKSVTIITPPLRGSASNTTRTAVLGAPEARADRITEPQSDLTNGRFVVPMGDGSAIVLGFILKGVDNCTAKARVSRWISLPASETHDSVKFPPQWTLVPWLDLSLIAGNKLGLTRTDGITPAVAADERYVDTIILDVDRSFGPRDGTTKDFISGTNSVISGYQPTPDNGWAHIARDVWAARKVEIEMTCVSVSAGTPATEANVFWQVIGSG